MCLIVFNRSVRKTKINEKKNNKKSLLKRLMELKLGFFFFKFILHETDGKIVDTVKKIFKC